MVTAVAQGFLAPSECTHTWLIDTPNGATSSGYCPRCNSTRHGFYNSMPEEPRVNNSDVFSRPRGGSRELWNEEDTDGALRSMYGRR